MTEPVASEPGAVMYLHMTPVSRPYYFWTERRAIAFQASMQAVSADDTQVFRARRGLRWEVQAYHQRWGS